MFKCLKCGQILGARRILYCENHQPKWLVAIFIAFMIFFFLAEKYDLFLSIYDRSYSNETGAESNVVNLIPGDEAPPKNACDEVGFSDLTSININLGADTYRYEDGRKGKLITMGGEVILSYSIEDKKIYLSGTVRAADYKIICTIERNKIILSKGNYLNSRKISNGIEIQDLNGDRVFRATFHNPQNITISGVFRGRPDMRPLILYESGIPMDKGNHVSTNCITGGAIDWEITDNPRKIYE